jgi:hypothetical protein
MLTVALIFFAKVLAIVLACVVIGFVAGLMGIDLEKWMR